LVDILSGRREVETSAALVTSDLKAQIDQFQLHGVGQWNAWVRFLLGSRRVTQLDLVPGAIAGRDPQRVLTAQWQGLQDGREAISPPFAVTFDLAGDKVAAIETRRADYTFVAGDSILPQVAFAAILGQLVG